MERASRLISKLGLPAEAISREEVALAVWPDAVGKRLAGHTRAAKLVRTRLVVEVEDRVWQMQLNSLSIHIVRNIEKLAGKGVVEDVEFRVVPRRREPQRATHSARTAPGLFDEADAIEDPGLRHIYKLSRKKALA